MPVATGSCQVSSACSRSNAVARLSSTFCTCVGERGAVHAHCQRAGNLPLIMHNVRRLVCPGHPAPARGRGAGAFCNLLHLLLPKWQEVRSLSSVQQWTTSVRALLISVHTHFFAQINLYMQSLTRARKPTTPSYWLLRLSNVSSGTTDEAAPDMKLDSLPPVLADAAVGDDGDPA